MRLNLLLRGRTMPALADIGLALLYGWFIQVNLRTAARGDPAMVVLLVQEFVVIGLALTRRRATTASGWDTLPGLLGWCGTLAPLYVRPAPLAPMPVAALGGALQLLGASLALGATLALGRSFGIVAANRGVRTGGLYQFIRHPIYAAFMLSLGGFTFAHPSAWNGLVWLAACGVQIGRIVVEERALSVDPRYRAYRARVRYRLLPPVW